MSVVDQYLCQITGYCQKADLHNPSRQLISMEQRGDAATETTSVPLKPLRTALCLRCRALHHCGDPDPSQTTGLTLVVPFNHLILIGIGRNEFMVPPPFHTKLSACAQPIKAATTRHGYPVLNHIMKNMTNELFSKSVLRHVPMGSRKGASAISCATIRSLRDRLTIRTRSAIPCETCTSSRSDLMTFRWRTTTSGRRMACSLPSRLQRHRGSGMSEFFSTSPWRHKESNARRPSGSNKEKMLSTMRRAKTEVTRTTIRPARTRLDCGTGSTGHYGTSTCRIQLWLYSAV